MCGTDMDNGRHWKAFVERITQAVLLLDTPRTFSYYPMSKITGMHQHTSNERGKKQPPFEASIEMRKRCKRRK